MADGIQAWRIGEVTVTSVLEEQTDHIPPELFFPSLTTEDVKREAWLAPHFADPDGNLSLRVQALVIEVAGRTIVVDPCVGNGKIRSAVFWNDQQWPFMERFVAAGFDPSAVDLVVHTHLHADHVGWGTQQIDGRWVPTFTSARYVYAEREMAWLRDRDDEDSKQIYADSVAPVAAAGLADLVAVDADLGSGLRFAPTAGHTPGHVSLRLDTGGGAVLVTGDVIHHPLQCARPSLAFASDADPGQAEATRLELLGSVADEGALMFGSHFPTFPAGRLLPGGGAWRFEPELPGP